MSSETEASSACVVCARTHRSKSHDELDQGDPHELAEQYRSLRAIWPQLTGVGCCCGTDHRHVDEICAVWTG